MLKVFPNSFSRFLKCLGVVLALVVSSHASSHGGVAFEDDLCVINIDFMQAHFTVFQPDTRETEEYCEDIPDVTRSVFVMEYLHDLLTGMSIDFRIIRDVNGVGRFADWADIEAIDDLDAVTVFYEEPRIEDSGFYSSSYEFLEKGTYIGVVTAELPEEDRYYNAVFYFRVGGRDWGTIPLFIVLALILQLGYWVSTGGYERWQERQTRVS